jgi:hypothetical protein
LPDPASLVTVLEIDDVSQLMLLLIAMMRNLCIKNEYQLKNN